MGMGSRERRVVWCVGLLVAGLLVAAAESDYCTGICRNSPKFKICYFQCKAATAPPHGGPRSTEEEEHLHLHGPAGSQEEEKLMSPRRRQDGGTSTVTGWQAQPEAVAPCETMDYVSCMMCCYAQPPDSPGKFKRCISHCRNGNLAMVVRGSELS
ncbi:hypothetical protein VPH35_107683 [Triticum aestivum]